MYTFIITIFPGVMLSVILYVVYLEIYYNEYR